MDKKQLLKQSMQKRAGLSSILSGIPVVGGAAHALIDPVEGSPRGTSLFYEGLGGGLGSALGGVGGALALRDKSGLPGLPGLVGGSVLGGIGGSLLGRWLAETNDDPEIEELKKIISELKNKQTTEAGGVTVNIGPTKAQALTAHIPDAPEKEVVELEEEDEDDA